MSTRLPELRGVRMKEDGALFSNCARRPRSKRAVLLLKSIWAPAASSTASARGDITSMPSSSRMRSDVR